MDSYVYLIQSLENSKYKIGTSKNPLKRVKSLQTGNGEKLKLIETYKSKHPYIVEKSLHNQYKHLNTIGEWYELSIDEEVMFIENCKKIENNINILRKMGNEYI